MVDATPRTLALVDASSIVFDRTWSTTLPVVGSASVELKILYAAPRFTFSITVTIAGRSFNWSQDVSGDVTIPISLVAGFGLELDITGWAASALQLSFDLLVKITGPFGFSVTLFHNRVNIPLPGRDEVNALAALEHGGVDHAAAFLTASAFAPPLARESAASLEAFGGIDGGVQIKNAKLQGGKFCCDVRIFAKAFGKSFDETIPNLCVDVQTCATVFSGGFAGIDVSIVVCYHDASHPNQACARLKASLGPFSKTFEQCINICGGRSGSGSLRSFDEARSRTTKNPTGHHEPECETSRLYPVRQAPRAGPGRGTMVDLRRLWADGRDPRRPLRPGCRD